MKLDVVSRSTTGIELFAAVSCVELSTIQTHVKVGNNNRQSILSRSLGILPRGEQKDKIMILNCYSEPHSAFVNTIR